MNRLQNGRSYKLLLCKNSTEAVQKFAHVLVAFILKSINEN